MLLCPAHLAYKWLPKTASSGPPPPGEWGGGGLWWHPHISSCLSLQVQSPLTLV